MRREFIDHLLRGDADIAGLVRRAEPFGLDFSRAHQIVFAGLSDSPAVTEEDESVLERGVTSRYGDRDVLVTPKAVTWSRWCPPAPTFLTPITPRDSLCMPCQYQDQTRGR